MRWCIAVMILLLSCIHSIANDGRVEGEGGRMRLAADETTSVRMVRETINIEVYPRYYDVTVDFVFHNEGPSTHVRMGFPESGGGDGVDGRKSRFISFHSLVDGSPIHVKRQIVHHGVNYLALWVKPVYFHSGQTHNIRVKYRSKPGEVAGEGNYVDYNFTGGNWKGNVAESQLFVTLHLPGTVLTTMGLPSANSMYRNKWRGHRLTLTWQNWQAQGDFFLGYRQTIAGALLLDGKKMCDQHQAIIPGSNQVRLPEWIPPAMQRRGIPQVELIVLKDILYDHGIQADISWKHETKEAVVTMGKHRFRFKCGSTVMDFDDKLLPMPNSPSLIGPASIGDIYSPHIFVPAKPIIKALGGSVAYSVKTHSLRVTFH